MKDGTTVAEWIEALSKMPKNLKLYVRPKYTGEASWTKDYLIKTRGLSEMDKGEVGEKHVCILF
jgi:hypothetical protein